MPASPPQIKKSKKMHLNAKFGLHSSAEPCILSPHSGASSNGDLSSAVEPQIVVLVVMGSNPIGHPAGGLRKNLVIPPLFLFTPLTCLRYACRCRVRFPLQSALMTPNWVKTTLCRHSVALCTSTVTLRPPQCPETPITY